MTEKLLKLKLKLMIMEIEVTTSLPVVCPTVTNCNPTPRANIRLTYCLHAVLAIFKGFISYLLVFIAPSNL